MRFVWGLLVSLLLVTGLSACASSDDEWTRNRGPSREAAERADDKEAECKDYWLFDYEEEDKSGNRAEQKAFALEHNDDDAEVEACENLLETIDWESLGDAQRAFSALEESGNLVIENVSKSVTLPTKSKVPSTYENDVGGPWNNAVKSLTPDDFYLDQHFMVHGICDARSQEAIVFFFDPHFVGSTGYESTAGNEYQKVWPGGSATTERSLPAPRFKFPLMGGIEQQESLGIKIIDKGSQTVIGAALIEVFVTQEISEIQTLVGDEASTETWYVCNFDLRINRTYKKSEKPDTEKAKFYANSFQHDFVLTEGDNSQSNYGTDLGKNLGGGVSSDIQCSQFPARRAHVGLGMIAIGIGAGDFYPIDQIIESTMTTETGIVSTIQEIVDGDWKGPLPPHKFFYAFPDDPSNKGEILWANTDIVGEPFYRTYAHIETDLSVDPTNDNFECSVRFDSLEIWYPMNNYGQKYEWPSKNQ
jgi:hypothetical protein